MKFKKKLSNSEIKDLTTKSYLTEIAFYIGTVSSIDNIIKSRLIEPMGNEYDGIMLFYMFVEYLYNEFMESDGADVYSFVDNNVDDLLDKFISENFEEI